MKKIISLMAVLLIIMISFGACNSNSEDKTLNNSVEQNKINESETIENNETMNQKNIINNLNENNTINEEQKESGNNNTEIMNNTEITNKLEINSGDNATQSISVVATSLSNKTNAWGFVRKKNEVRPEFAAQYTKVLDDYEGIYAGNPDEKVIYLTFDEGYENGYTGAILDTLKEKDCPATFFVTKPYVKQNQDLVKRMIDEGHIVGNHISRTSMYHIKIS